MIKFFKKNNKKNGYAILELLFYISFFAILSFLVINAMIIMSQSFRETSLYAEFQQGGTIMERITREIRQAYNISSISANDLVLSSKDSEGVNKTVEFLLSGSNLQLIENSVLTGNLNAPSISVTALIFTQINIVKGKAVKIFLTIKSTKDSSNRLNDFYDTIVLRGGY